MRKLLQKSVLLLLAIFSFGLGSLFAQIPQAINFQAIARDGDSNPMVNTNIQIRLSVLDGSPEGTVVYQELRALQTNAYGSFSFQIGVGANFVTIGTMDGIEWENGSKYLKIDYDPSNTFTFNLTLGTIEFVSVPYAFAAETVVFIDATGAEDGDVLVYNEATGKFVASASLTDGSETKIQAGNNTTVTGNGTTVDPYVINAVGGGSTAHYVGELYGGGVVFWVDHTGNNGLICSMIDLSTAQVWSNVTDILIGTTNDWDGAANSVAIIGQSGHTVSAAKLCDNYTNADYGTETFSDWYLPSKAELYHIWNNFYEIQKALSNDGNGSTTPIAKQYYWSSSEYNGNGAYLVGFDGGGTSYDNKNNTYYVRAVRAF